MLKVENYFSNVNRSYFMIIGKMIIKSPVSAFGLQAVGCLHPLIYLLDWCLIYHVAQESESIKILGNYFYLKKKNQLIEYIS
jgi:hypothetical protein